MALDIGGNLISQSSSVLTITAGAAMQLRATGSVSRPNNCQFQAGGNAAGAWVTLSDTVFNKMPFATPFINDDACYSAANARFTAPVAGTYFFEASCYLVKNGASDAYYFHPMFFVNGSGSLGVAGDNPNYRIRGHGMSIASYTDSHVTQVYSLAAGDYVEHQLYCNCAGTGQYYAAYTRFTGFLLG
jgi:hypothetical protein